MSYELECPRCGKTANNDEEAIGIFEIEYNYDCYDIKCLECGKEFTRSIPDYFFGEAIHQDEDGNWNWD